MIELSDLVERKHHAYPYKPSPVEDKKLTQVLETASLAATRDSSRPFLFVVVRTATKKAILRPIFEHDWFVQAPVVICACTIAAEARDYNEETQSQNVVAIIPVVNQLTLAAANEDLGTCWFTGFNVQRARQLLDLPEEVEPVACTPLGYPVKQSDIEKWKSDKVTSYKN